MGGIFERAMDQIYRTQIATDATLQGVAKTVRVIDKSDGMDAPTPRTKLKVPTVRPAVTIRDKEVHALGLTVANLVGKSITFNGKTWWVHATEPRPRPDGASESFLYIRSTR